MDKDKLVEALGTGKMQAQVAVAIRDAANDQGVELSPPQWLYIALKALDAVTAALRSHAVRDAK